jgi:hypothetical protein
MNQQLEGILEAEGTELGTYSFVYGDKLNEHNIVQLKQQ